MNFYNECDPKAAAWLRRLIAAGELPPGDVDPRPIELIDPRTLDGYTSVHLFAGIGGWPLALRQAGWPDDCPVWTGSCPCQPFSDAGARRGFDDDRHLWPHFLRLIREHRPRVIFGEQVSSKDGLKWFDAVSSDLEGEGYAVGALDLCAASVGAPHRRQRLYFVGHADGDAAREHARELPCDEGGDVERRAKGGHAPTVPGRARSVADADEARRQLKRPARVHDHGEPRHDAPGRRARVDWSDCEWALCGDPSGPRWRPIEPGSFPLADGVPARLEQLRAFGNAIVVPLAAEFIAAYMDVTEGRAAEAARGEAGE